jgi:hypothetical protein
MIRHFSFLRLKEEHLDLANTMFASISARGVLVDLTLAAANCPPRPPIGGYRTSSSEGLLSGGGDWKTRPRA